MVWGLHETSYYSLFGVIYPIHTGSNFIYYLRLARGFVMFYIYCIVVLVTGALQLGADCFVSLVNEGLILVFVEKSLLPSYHPVT